MPKVAIIGAGIIGLKTAYDLKKKNVDVTLLESQKNPGGVIQSHTSDGFLSEAGPTSLDIGDPEIRAFLEEINLTDKITASNPRSKNRYVVHNDTLVAIPDSFTNFLKTPLLSPPGKFKLIKEPFVKRSKKNHEESLAEFIERRLGKEVLDAIVDPFVSGIYAGNPHTLSAKYAFPFLYEIEQADGSLLKGSIKKRNHKPFYASFKEGMYTLPQALAQELGTSLKLNAKILKITKKKDDWKLVWESKKTKHEATFDYLIGTVPAHKYPNLPFDKDTKSLFLPLSQIAYAPVTTLTLGFHKKDVKHPLDGRGFLIPSQDTHFKILGTLFNSTIFPNRAPKNYVNLTTFVGGSQHPDLAGLSITKLKALVMNDLEKLINVKGDPVFINKTFWPQAIPQYNVGYGHFFNLMESIEEQFPNFEIKGNFRTGIALQHCLKSKTRLLSTL